MKQYWWIVLVAVLACVGATAIFAERQRPSYMARATLVVGPSDLLAAPRDAVESLNALDRRSVVATLAHLSSSQAIQARAQEQLRLSAQQAAWFHVSTVVIPDTNILEITVTGPGQRFVPVYANAIAGQTIAYSRNYYPVYELKLLDPAAPDGQPVGADMSRKLLAGGILGLLIGVGAAFLLNRYLSLLWSVLRDNWGSSNLFFGAIGIFPKSVFIAGEVERLGISHVHAHYATHPALAALIVSRLTGASFSFTAHAHDIFLHQQMLAEKVSAAGFVVAISKFNKAYLVDHAPGVPDAKIKVVHCGIEPERYRASASRANPPSGSDTLTAVCVASLQPYKGLRHLVRACGEVLRHVRDFRCLIVGEGAERTELEALILELGLQDSVQLLGGNSRRFRPQRQWSSGCSRRPTATRSVALEEWPTPSTF